MKPQDVENARKTLGLTQAAFGREVGLTGATPDRTVREWEAGRNPVPGTAARAIELLLERHARKNRRGK